METQSALAAKAGDEFAKLKLTTEAGTVELRRSMQKEHERGDALARDLSTARSKVYAYEAQAAQASDEAAKRKQESQAKQPSCDNHSSESSSGLKRWRVISQQRKANSMRRPSGQPKRTCKPPG